MRYDEQIIYRDVYDMVKWNETAKEINRDNYKWW